MTESVSRETMERLEAYVALIRKWSPKINLISRGDLAHIWERHIEDSLQVAAFAQPDQLWSDLGSGGGLPGIVVAITQPKTQIHLVESDQRKAAFLRTCARELDLTLTVHSQRIEVLPPLQADILSARALAPLSQLLEWVARHLIKGGSAILPKGENVTMELAEAQKTWSFSYTAHPSKTRAGATILQIESLTRA